MEQTLTHASNDFHVLPVVLNQTYRVENESENKYIYSLTCETLQETFLSLNNINLHATL